MDDNFSPKLTPELEDFYSYLATNIPLSLFVVVNNTDITVEDVAVAPITQDMILNYLPEPLILFSDLDPIFEQFKDRHLQNLELPMPDKTFLRFNFMDTSNFPDLIPCGQQEYVQDILIPLKFKEATYNQSFGDEYIRKAYKKISHSPKDFALSIYDFSVPSIRKYKDIPTETESQISSFLFSNLNNTEVFIGKQKELEALRETQYYKINHVDEDFNLTDDKVILPIDILIAKMKGDDEKANFIKHLYSLQNGTACLRDTLSPVLMFRQLQITLDYFGGLFPDEVKMSEAFISSIEKLPQPTGNDQYNKMIALLSEYHKISEYNKDIARILRGEQPQSRYTDGETIIANIIIKQIQLLENVTEVTDQWKKRFINLQNSLVHLDENLSLNYSAIACKIEELEKIFYPDRMVLCEIELKTREEFYPILKFHLANIICGKTDLIKMDNGDENIINDNIKLLWKQYEKLCVCDPNSSIIFHTRFITNRNLIALEPFLLDSFINNYSEYLGFNNSIFLCVAEERGLQIELNLFIKNVTNGNKPVFLTDMGRLQAKRAFYDCRSELHLPLYPLEESNSVRENLNTYLTNNPDNPQDSNKLYPKI